MAGIRVKWNRLPGIVARLPQAIDEEVDEAGKDLAGYYRRVIWRDSGLLRRVTNPETAGRNHAEVEVGYYLGHGFYSGFQEFGTRKQVARPMVVPGAHIFEPIYAANMGRAIRKACGIS